MIPTNGVINSAALKTAERPSKTFLLGNGRAAGAIDGLDAVKQAVFLILNVERYDWPIYSWNYGAELRDVIGMPGDLAQAELKRRIAGALEQDDRIQSVEDFALSFSRRAVHVSFTVRSVFGDFSVEKEVSNLV